MGWLRWPDSLCTDRLFSCRKLAQACSHDGERVPSSKGRQVPLCLGTCAWVIYASIILARKSHIDKTRFKFGGLDSTSWWKELLIYHTHVRNGLSCWPRNTQKLLPCILSPFTNIWTIVCDVLLCFCGSLWVLFWLRLLPDLTNILFKAIG